MTYDDKVKKLCGYETKYYRVEWIENHIRGVKAISYEERVPGPKKTLNEYLQEKINLEDEMFDIETMINNIEDEKERYILEYKFLYFKSLEEVAIIMNYSLRQIQRMYKKGINNMKDVVQCRTMSQK